MNETLKTLARDRGKIYFLKGVDNSPYLDKIIENLAKSPKELAECEEITEETLRKLNET
jgi:hypothetical protein